MIKAPLGIYLQNRRKAELMQQMVKLPLVGWQKFITALLFQI